MKKKRGKGKRRSVCAKMWRKSVWRKNARNRMWQDKSERKRKPNREHK
jgi:hypothetical protein